MDSVLRPIRQSAAELTAYAVSTLFPDVLLVGGEATEEGFYYDFIMEQPLHKEGLVIIEEQMRQFIREDLEVKTPEMMRENAAEYFMHHGQKIKANLVLLASSNIVTLFHVGEFRDFCPSPYITHTKQITAFKLLDIAQEDRFIPTVGTLTVTRIKGAAYDNPKKLKKCIKAEEKVKKRDHRVLGRELDLFTVKAAVAGDGWFWHPKGSIVRETLLNWWRLNCRDNGFQFVATPGLLDRKFLKISGDRELSAALPPLQLEESEYSLTTGRALQHTQLYQTRPRTYRDLPLRYAEFGESYRHLESAQLKGALRSRSFFEDTLTVFCNKEQFTEELNSCLHLVGKCANMLGFDYAFIFKGRGEKSAGTLKKWEQVELLMEEALKLGAYDYQRCHSGAYEGPRIELILTDSLSREWKGPEIAIDFNLTERFNLRYQAADDDMHAPLMMRTAIFGSLERLVAILVEHTAGKFPLWLAPEQVRVVPVTENHRSYAQAITAMGMSHGLRVCTDQLRDTLRAKIHAAAQDNVPYIVIVGDEEENNGVVTVRSTYTDKVDAKADPKALFLEIKKKATT